MGACGAFQVARAKVRGGMLCVRACRRAPPAVCMPKRPRIRSARAGQRPAHRHHQGEGHTAKSGRDSALARARSTVKCCQNPGQIKSEPRSDRIRAGGQMNRNPQATFRRSCAFQSRRSISTSETPWQSWGRPTSWPRPSRRRCLGCCIDTPRTPLCLKAAGAAIPSPGGGEEATRRSGWAFTHGLHAGKHESWKYESRMRSRRTDRVRVTRSSFSRTIRNSSR